MQFLGQLAVPRNGWSHGVWNRDIPPIEGFNLYGDHPVWIVFEKASNQYFGYVFWNSNAKSFQAFQDKIVIRAAGGIIDLFFMRSETFEGVVEKIHHVVGKPVDQPLWAFGYHLCRWGYNTSEETMRIAGKRSKIYHNLNVCYFYLISEACIFCNLQTVGRDSGANKFQISPT